MKSKTFLKETVIWLQSNVSHHRVATVILFVVYQSFFTLLLQRRYLARWVEVPQPMQQSRSHP